jgi:large subunit ribosomal protein L29
MTTAKELLQLSTEDLARRASELRLTLAQDNLKLRTGSLDNPSERTGHKRDLARVLTIMSAKQSEQKVRT